MTTLPPDVRPANPKRHSASNDNERNAYPISFAQAKHLAEMPSYLRGGRI